MWWERWVGKRLFVFLSGISSWKKMDNAINIRGVTDMPLLKFEIDILFDAVNLYSEGRSTRKVVYDGSGRRKIDRC
jgi:hypothetical protein